MEDERAGYQTQLSLLIDNEDVKSENAIETGSVSIVTKSMMMLSNDND